MNAKSDQQIIAQINDLIGETDSEVLAEIYTNIFYACFANTFVSCFSQTTNALRLRKTTKGGYVDLVIVVESNADHLPKRPGDSIKFYELLNVVGGNRKMANISPVIQFKTLPKHFLEVDEWLKSISSVSISLDVRSNSVLQNDREETFAATNLKIIESYQVENLSVANTASGAVINLSGTSPAAFTVTLSDWIVDALSKDYLRLSVVEKLLRGRELLPVIR